MSAEIDNVTGIYNAYKKYYEQDGQYSDQEKERLVILDGKIRGLNKQREALEKLTI